MPKVLNVGGNNKEIPLPPQYQGWEHILLDIDARGNPDIVADARELTHLAPAQFDAVYCSHNLEHYYRHDCVKVLRGFLHVLNEDGFAQIAVPDIGGLFKVVNQKNLDIDDFLYQSPAGPILVRDVLYGYGVEIERSGLDYFSHKTGFTQKSLLTLLQQSGFAKVYIGAANLEIQSVAFKSKPTAQAAKLFGIQEPSP